MWSLKNLKPALPVILGILTSNVTVKLLLVLRLSCLASILWNLENGSLQENENFDSFAI